MVVLVLLSALYSCHASKCWLATDLGTGSETKAFIAEICDLALTLCFLRWNPLILSPQTKQSI